jgi:TldD protein
VTEDELVRITRVATEVARASAIAKKRDVLLASTPAYVENYVTPMLKDPRTVSAADKQAWAQRIVDKASKVQGVTGVNVSINTSYEWRYFASTEGSYIEQELFVTSPPDGRVGGSRRATTRVPAAGRKSPKKTISDVAEKVATDAVEMYGRRSGPVRPADPYPRRTRCRFTKSWRAPSSTGGRLRGEPPARAS